MNFRPDPKPGPRKRRGLRMVAFTLAKKGESFCRNCGSWVRLHLHHIIPRSKFPAGRDELLNGMCLCEVCHMGWHLKIITLFRDLIRPDEWDFLTSVTLTGESVIDWLDRHYPVRPA